MRHVLLLGSRLLAVAVGLSSVAVAAPPSAEVARGAYRLGVHHLATERLSPALEQAARCEEAAPGLSACRSLRGRVLAAMGRCEEAVAVLAGIRGEAAWGAQDAIAEGSCHLALGDRARAQVAFVEAAAMAVSSEAVQEGILWAYATSGMLREVPEGVAARTRLVAAVLGGDPRAAALLDLPPPGGSDDLLGWLRCELALRQGDPLAAEAAIVDGAGRGEAWRRGLVCRAEARRRLGDPQAVARLGALPFLDPAAPWWRWIRARALVDLGRVDEAGALLPSTVLLAGPEAAAAAWYVARALGDEPVAAMASKAWAAWTGQDEAALGSLLPIVQVEAAR